MIGKDGDDCCDGCFDLHEIEVDANYTCVACDDALCFDHMIEWPQPEWMDNKPIRYCIQCFKQEWMEFMSPAGVTA